MRLRDSSLLSKDATALEKMIKGIADVDNNYYHSDYSGEKLVDNEKSISL